MAHGVVPATSEDEIEGSPGPEKQSAASQDHTTALQPGWQNKALSQKNQQRQKHILNEGYNIEHIRAIIF